MQSGKLELDGPTLEVLASNTRRDLLKALDKRRKTLTELSGEMGIKKPAVLNHLVRLMEVGLVFIVKNHCFMTIINSITILRGGISKFISPG